MGSYVLDKLIPEKFQMWRSSNENLKTLLLHLLFLSFLLKSILLKSIQVTAFLST